jgi:hypothetical protein
MVVRKPHKIDFYSWNFMIEVSYFGERNIMIKKIISNFVPGEAIETTETRRRHTRTDDNFSTVVVDSNEYPVRDWSQGGVFFMAVNRNLNLGDKVNLTLRFELPHQTVEFSHSGTIIRTTFDGYAVQLAPLTREIREKFARVMDSIVSMGFDETQNISTYH